MTFEKSSSYRKLYIANCRTIDNCICFMQLLHFVNSPAKRQTSVKKLLFQDVKFVKKEHPGRLLLAQ